MSFLKIKNKTNYHTFIITIGFMAITLLSCNSNNDSGNKEFIKLVKTAKVVEISPINHKHYPAILEEAEEVNLAFRVAGPILKIHVKEGQFVTKGQLIAEMDDRDYMVQKTAVEAQVIQLQSEYKRVEELNKRKSVADNDYEKMKAGKEMAEAKLKNANDQLNDTRLYAPFSGYITKVMFDEGELVNHGTAIASLIDVSLLKAEIDVPVSMYIKKDEIINIECTQESLMGKIFPLELYANNIKANNNGLYKFYLYHKPTNNSRLVPGMNISVNIEYSEFDTTILSIPIIAIYDKDESSYVWVVKDNIVTARKIETNNNISDGRIGIVSGLSKDEEIITGGLKLLTEGELVNVVKAPSKTNIGNLL